MEVGGWRLEVGGWRLEVGGWRMEVGGWRLDTDIAESVQGAGPPQGVIGDQRVQKTNGFP